MRSEQAWSSEELEATEGSLTRRGVLTGSLKLAGAGALALAFAGGTAHSRLVLAQDDAAATPQAEDEEGAETEADREARRAARQAEDAEDAVGGGTTVATVPTTGVGTIVGSSMGPVAGAIGLAAASVTAAILSRRGAFRQGSGDE
jgi:hypothetical protein